MDLLAFIRIADPTKVKVGERQHAEDEPKLLDSTIGRVVPLLPVALNRPESELETRVDRLFEEGGSGNQTEQGNSTGGGQGADIQLVSEATYIVVEDVAPLQPRRQRKQKTVVVDVGESSHPAKKLREDHETPSRTSVGGKSMSAVQQLLVGAVLNADVRGEAIPTLPFVTSSVSTTPEREGGDHTDSVAGTNLRTVSAPQRFVISSDSSHHFGANVAEAEVDSLVRSSVPIMTAVTTVTSTVDPALTAKEKTAKPSPFVTGSSLAGRNELITGGFSDLTGSDFLVGGIRIVIDPDTDIQKVYLPQFFASIRGMEHDQLFTEFNVGAARQMSLSAEEVKAAEAIRLHAEASKFEAVEKSLQDEVQALKEHNTSLEKERDALDVKVTELETSAVGKDRELTDLNAQLTFVKSHNDKLVDQVHELEMSSSRLQEKLSRWLLTHGLKLFLVKCLNSSEYLTDLGAAISCAIEKGMQDGLAAGINHGMKGRSLADVAAYNPSAGADYNSSLQELCEVDFSLLAELKSHKDASIEDIMSLLRLESPLVDVPGMGDLQPDIEQLKVSIHRSEDHVVLGETSLSFALSVSHSRVERIRANIAAEQSALLALSTTFASANSIPPNTVDDFEIVHVDSQESSQGNVQGDTAMVEFEKEDLNTTPEHDLLN
ncbi:hypothetical protein Tco_1358807, partial [Tanacetum coccineum]